MKTNPSFSFLAHWRGRMVLFGVLLMGIFEMNAQCPGTSIAFNWGGGTVYNYTYNGMVNGKCSYLQASPGTLIVWSGTQWNIYGTSVATGTVFFHSSVDVGDRPSNRKADWVQDMGVAWNSMTGTGVITPGSVAAPTATAQSFCGSATVADLVASGVSGATFNWYDVANGGTALASNTVLATGTYYVSQTSNAEESSRTAVDVTINITSAPTANDQSFCGSGTVADLVATGTAVKWYTGSSGGTALSTSTALASGTYYASQTLNGCESSRTMVTVTVSAIPTYSGGTFYVANGTQIQNILGFNSSFLVYSSATSPSPVSNNTTLTAGTYYGSYTVNGCESTRAVVTVINYTLPSIASPSCGSRLGNISAPIRSTTVTNASQYVFEVSANNVIVGQYFSSTNSFNLTQINASVSYDTTYSVRVAPVFSNGQVGSYSNSCQLTTPVTPTTTVTSAICGTTLANKWSKVFCTQVYGATGYRFQFTNGTTVLTYDSTASNMQLNNLVGWTTSTTYSVRVAIKIGTVWQSFGNACNVTTPASMARVSTNNSKNFTVKAVPNPYTSDFSIVAQGNTETPIQVEVFDMNGRMVQQFEAQGKEVDNLSVGNGLSSGTYNVVVTQGDNQQTVRVIKK